MSFEFRFSPCITAHQQKIKARSLRSVDGFIFFTMMQDELTDKVPHRFLADMDFFCNFCSIKYIRKTIQNLLAELI